MKRKNNKLNDEQNSRILSRFKKELNIDVDKIYKDLESQNLLNEERPKTSRKPLIIALTCTAVVVVCGVIVGIEYSYGSLIKHKNVEALNLDGDDYCFALLTGFLLFL